MPELVALDLPGGVGFVDALQAIWDTGDAAAPLDPRLPLVARNAMLDALRPTRIVGSDGEQHALSGGLPVAEGDALVVATSGTSGEPKGVVLTHDAVVASARATSARLGIDPSRHTWLACLPLAHIGGLSVVTRSIVTGTPVAVMPGFEAEAVEAAGRSGRVTHVALVTTALQRIDPSVFRCVLLGGSKAPDALPPNVVATYGMTETGSGVVYDGTPLEAVEITFRSPERSVTTTRTGDDAAREGEILIRAPMLFRRYRDGSDGRVVGPDGRKDWFATGDAGRLGADGRLVISGRIADVITTGAEKVWPDLVERVLSAHPDVVEVAVWKRSDPEWGERVVAWVVPSDDAPSLEELRHLVAETIAPWAAPKELVIVDDLPRTAAGKVRRRELESFRS
ncbi:MAG: class I adenylate-forming enzyme family protein [Acidimicrobiales bacterium]